MYLAFEHLPTLPEIFIPLIYDKIIQGKDEFDKKYNAVNYEFLSLQANDDLVIWIRNNVISKIVTDQSKIDIYKIGVHLIKNKIAIHKDHDRDATINYILDSGGRKFDEVPTSL